MIKIACSYVKSLFKCFNVNSFVEPRSYFICVSHSVVSLIIHSIHFCFLTCLLSMEPTYMLSSTQMEYDILKKRAEEERLKSSGNLVL